MRISAVRKSLRVALVLLALVGLFAPIAFADVQSTGVVDPVRNPFDSVNYPGLPVSGNFINPIEEPNPANPNANNQTNFEGLFDINIGQTSPSHSAPHSPGDMAGYGAVLISSNTQLRYQDVIIGGSVQTGANTKQTGTGVFRIDGFGALYNNNPTILPFGLNPLTFGSKRSATAGYDIFVGKSGNGTLEISAGGRAEIQDAVLVGDEIGAVGSLVVDGFDSFLGSGGMATAGSGSGSGGQSLYHQMIIGRQGTGVMTISGGATVASESPQDQGSSTAVGQIGAVLGSTPLSTTGSVLDAGGTGTATVTGIASKWTIGGSLQVGGFDIGLEGGTTIGDVEGDTVVYSSQAGRGTLYVNDGALVTVRNAIGVSPTSTTPPSLLLAIGHFGVVDLNGGTIRIGNTLGTTGQADQSTPDTVQLINDGVIRGTGRINTGVFRNRYLGEVRVAAGQSLVIDSSSQFLSSIGNSPPEPLSNFGKMEIFGNVNAQAQLEFIRAPANGTNAIRPFINRPLRTPLPAPSFTGGQISAQYANLLFGSGLQNESMLAFTAGTNNITGRVVSVGLDAIDPNADDGDAGDTAQVLVNGPGTTAVFHDDLVFGEGADLNLVNGGKVVVLNQHSFVMAGNLNIELSYTHPSLITVGGDVGIGPGASNNDLSLALASDALHSLKHGDAFQIISYTGDIGNVNVTNPLSPVVDYANAPLFTDVDVSPDIFALYNLVAQVQFAPQGVYVVFLDPTMVGPGAGAIAPDFNGDGVIDLADFAIWQAHVGQTGGASVLDGDADGDGDVDGADFLKWQRNVGKPMPWTGSGSGSGSGTSLANVPEPTSLMLLACGSLALAFGRRRLAR